MSSGGGALAGGYVARPRLTDVVAANRVTAVEAGAGFGKSALASECIDGLSVVGVVARLDVRDANLELFVTRLRRAFRLAGLSDLAAAANPQSADAIDDILSLLAMTTEPVLLVLDDVHNAESDELTRAILDLAATLPAPHRLLILGRNLTGTARKLRYAHGVASLSAAELAFRRDELETVLGPLADAHADDVMHATQGWPAAVVLATRVLERDTGASGTLDRITPHTAVVELVRLVLEELSGADSDVLVQLAHLPLLSALVCEVVTGDTALWGRLTAAGVPLGSSHEGFAELPGPVQDQLVLRAPLKGGFARRAAEVYCELGEIRAALDVVVAVGDYSAATAVIADHSRRGVPPLEFSEVAGVVDAMPERALVERPNVLLVLARLAGRADRFVHRFAALTRLEALLAEGVGDRRVQDELHIEVAHDLLRLWKTPEASERIAGVAERLTADEPFARARLLAIQGRIACRFGDVDEGIRLLDDATKLALQIGDRDHAATCTYAIATEGLYEVSRLEEALEVAKRSLALAASPAHRLARLNLIADFETDLGRYEAAEAALAEQLELAQRQRAGRWLGYVPWGHARIASQQGDAGRTKRAIADVVRHFDQPWFDENLKVVFRADAADMLGRVGEATLAKQYMGEALDQWEGDPCNVIDAMLEARIGDPATAEHKFATLDNRRERREEWRVLLLRAYAAYRGGAQNAAELAGDAFDQAAADGLLSSLLAREATVAQQLVGLAAQAGSVAARGLLAGNLPWSLTLLGEFEVRHGGAEVALPPGKPTQAVKVVAVLGGRATLDELVDALWPDGDLEAGRRGVRNLLNRLKPVAADLLQREGNDLILDPAATIDFAQFESEVQAAVRAPAGDPSRTTLGRAALARYQGELLPSDRYEPWSAVARERARRRFGDLVDMLIDEAEAAGEVDEAVRLCERAIEVDPYDDERYLRAARLLFDRGRRTHARAVLDRGKAMLAELGIEPTGPLADLAERLAAP